MNEITGTFNGTGAQVFVCCGFIPDEVRIISAGDAEVADMLGTRDLRVAALVDGFMNHGGAQAVTLYTAGTGLQPYYGGDLMTATNQTSTAYGEGIYLGWDRGVNPARSLNYAQDNVYGYQGGSPIDTWNLDTSGNRTGSFNADVQVSGTTRIGAGSRILIEQNINRRQRWATIEALTAGQGIADDEVTLSEAISSGKVRYIGGQYDMVPIPIGETTPQGFILNVTTDTNMNDQMQVFIAKQYANGK